MIASALPALGVLFLLFVAVGIASTAFWIWMLVDSIGHPEWAYERARTNKVLWIVLIAVLGVILAIVYYFAIRPGVLAAVGAGPPSRPAPSTQWATPPRFCRSCGAAGQSGAFCAACGAATT